MANEVIGSPLDLPETFVEDPLSQQQSFRLILSPFLYIQDTGGMGDPCWWHDCSRGKPVGNRTTPGPKDESGKPLLDISTILCLRPLRVNGMLVNPAKEQRGDSIIVRPLEFVLVSYTRTGLLKPGETPDLSPSRDMTFTKNTFQGFLRYRSTPSNAPGQPPRKGWHGTTAYPFVFSSMYPTKNLPVGASPTWTLFLNTGGGTPPVPQQQPPQTKEISQGETIAPPGDDADNPIG